MAVARAHQRHMPRLIAPKTGAGKRKFPQAMSRLRKKWLE
jgi:hypothetical protein